MLLMLRGKQKILFLNVNAGATPKIALDRTTIYIYILIFYTNTIRHFMV